MTPCTHERNFRLMSNSGVYYHYCRDCGALKNGDDIGWVKPTMLPMLELAQASKVANYNCVKFFLHGNSLDIMTLSAASSDANAVWLTEYEWQVPRSPKGGEKHER
jgi:hypothetical protein